MLKKLRARWKVNGWNLLLIITTFAAGGSLCGYAARKILLLTNLERNAVWFILYIILITILWPVCVLVVSIPLGQFTFFKKYILKIRNRMLLKRREVDLEKKVTRIAIFASGAGTNAGKIIGYFKDQSEIKIELIVTNKPNAGVVRVAADNNIEHFTINKNQLPDISALREELEKHKIDFIILAGFLLKLPPALIDAFPKRIINIHPALLPAYGGKGMYGIHVHDAVIANKEKQSGITIHYADNMYDHGEIIFQSKCDIDPSDTAETLSHKVQLLEHRYYPGVIEQVLKAKNALKQA